nr:hypothetical protein [Kiloniella laminariae]
MSLKTRDYDVALKRADIVNAATETKWREGLAHTDPDIETRYEAAIALARRHGVQYVPLDVLAAGKLDELVSRMRVLQETGIKNKAVVSSVLGAVDSPKFTWSNAFERFVELSKKDLINKNPDQVRRWKNRRLKAVNNLIALVGDKGLDETTRNDALDLRSWWIDRLDSEGLKPDSANKDIGSLKKIYDDLNDYLRLGLTPGIFSGLTLSEDQHEIKMPFERDHVSKFLVNRQALLTLNDQARMIVWAFASTGAGLSELIGLRSQDIHLDCEIPYIELKPNEVRGEDKTRYRKRDLPIVGSALEAFKAFPKGFTRYQGKPSSCSAAVGSYLREHKLLPSINHTLNSLRHTFQDALTAAEAPERTQADLMGHKFAREKYGVGSTMEQKLKWIKEAVFYV